MDISEFEEFFVYDDQGNVLGLNSQATEKAKIEYRKWVMDQKDKERLAKLFEQSHHENE